MAIPLQSHRITGVYALGKWFHVVPGSFFVDVYNLRQWDDNDCHNPMADGFTDYQMGAAYSWSPDPMVFRYREDSHGYSANPSALHAVCFVEVSTGERVSFSLLEAKAFRELAA